MHTRKEIVWFEKETKTCLGDKSQIECNFNTSGDTVIHPDDIAWVNERIQDPQYRTGWDRNFWIWEKYIEGEQYLLVGDVARGDGTDSSSFMF